MNSMCRAARIALFGIAIFAGSSVVLHGDGLAQRFVFGEQAEDKKRMERLIRSSDRLGAADRKMREAYEQAFQARQVDKGFLEDEQDIWLMSRNGGAICEQGPNEIACLERFIMARTNQISARRDAAIAVGGEYIAMVQKLVDGCWEKAERMKPGRGMRPFLEIEIRCLVDIVVRIRALYRSTETFEGSMRRPFDEAEYRESLFEFMRQFSEVASFLQVCHACGSIWIEIIDSHSRQIIQSLIGIASKSYRDIPEHVYFNSTDYETWKSKP